VKRIVGFGIAFGFIAQALIAQQGLSGYLFRGEKADPATVFAGVIPAPPDLDELLLAGFLRRAPVELVRCRTVDLAVPANAEIILEGEAARVARAERFLF